MICRCRRIAGTGQPEGVRSSICGAIFLERLRGVGKSQALGFILQRRDSSRSEFRPRPRRVGDRQRAASGIHGFSAAPCAGACAHGGAAGIGSRQHSGRGAHRSGGGSRARLGVGKRGERIPESNRSRATVPESRINGNGEGSLMTGDRFQSDADSRGGRAGSARAHHCQRSWLRAHARWTVR